MHATKYVVFRFLREFWTNSGGPVISLILVNKNSLVPKEHNSSTLRRARSSVTAAGDAARASGQLLNLQVHLVPSKQCFTHWVYYSEVCSTLVC